MKTTIVTLTILAGLSVLAAETASAHDAEVRFDRNFRAGVVHHAHPDRYDRFYGYDRFDRDRRHYEYDRRHWHKYSRYQHKHWRKLVRAHDRWHRHNDHRRDRHYYRDHHRLHRQLGLSIRDFHYRRPRHW